MRDSRTDADAAAAVTLLRAPAAVIAGGFLVGLIAGEVTRPAASPPSSPVTYLITAFVCAPFLLPFSRPRARRALCQWMFAAAAVATGRAVVLALWLYSRRPLDAWMLKTAFDMAVSGVLWVAAFAVWRTRSA